MITQQISSVALATISSLQVTPETAQATNYVDT